MSETPPLKQIKTESEIKQEEEDEEWFGCTTAKRRNNGEPNRETTMRDVNNGAKSRKTPTGENRGEWNIEMAEIEIEIKEEYDNEWSENDDFSDWDDSLSEPDDDSDDGTQVTFSPTSIKTESEIKQEEEDEEVCTTLKRRNEEPNWETITRDINNGAKGRKTHTGQEVEMEESEVEIKQEIKEEIKEESDEEWSEDDELSEWDDSLSDPDDNSNDSEEECNGSSSVPSRSVSRTGPGEHGDTRNRSSNSCTVVWKTEEDPDVKPSKLKFAPRRKPGVQAPLNTGRPKPLDIFQCFFDAEVLELLCSNTNKNAARLKKKRPKFLWQELRVEELKKFIGLLLYMGVMDLPKITDLWRKQTIFAVPFPSSVMSRDRFRAILSAVHISDPADDAQNDKAKGQKHYDILHRVRPLLELMRTRCMAVYHPQQHISVDERMVGTKARLCFKQYIKSKPTRWGLKFFVLADSNGYTVDYRLYTGKSKDRSGKGLPFDVVTSLVNRNYLGTGYIVYCDSFYTSPLLFNHLGQQGFGACGTYRQGTACVPKTEENALTKKSPRGSIRWIRDGDLLFVKWMDTREVSLCSNVHSVYSGETVMRWKRKEDGKYERVPVPQPTVVKEYNHYMGGVDSADQMLGTNSVHRKTKRWYITVFQHMLDLAVTNSYIISKMLSTNWNKKPMSRQQFQEELCAQLFGVPLNSQVLQDEEPQPLPMCGHYPVPTCEGVGDVSLRASSGRRKCFLCKRSTPWQCEVCELALCVQLDRNCFKMYHRGP